MKKTMLTIVAAVFIAVLFSGNGLLITHAASTNSFSSRTGDNSGNHGYYGSDNGDHSQGNGGNSGTGTGNGDHSSGSGNGQQSSQTLSLTITGGVVSAGNQYYTIEQSGQVVMASFTSQYTIDPSQPTQFNYFLSAMVQGMTASGYAGFHLTGTLVGGGMIQLSGQGKIVGTVAAVCLPNYDAPNADGSCPTGDTSQVPGYFIGMENIQVSIGTSKQTMQGVTMLFESAYLNPFGAPLVLGTADNFATLQIVTTYSHATVQWNNVVDEASVSGTLGNQQVGGMLTQVASEYENLVTGTAIDHGTITFSSMSMPSIDVSGQYSGSSTTPTSLHQDCSASLGFPADSGMCTDYGFQSTGNFHMHSSGQQSISVSGSYKTTWPIPAFAFGGAITATVSQ